MANYEARLFPRRHPSRPSDGIYRQGFYPVGLSVSGRIVGTLELPFQPLPGGKTAIALLMTAEGNFPVVKALARYLSLALKDENPEVIVGIPTLGLILAEKVAANLGHPNYIPLFNTRKYWFSRSLATPVGSVTSRGRKMLRFDPNILGRLQRAAGGTLVIVDDVINTAGSASASIILLRKILTQVLAEARPKRILLAVALTEGHAWEEALTEIGFDWRENLTRLGHIPIFRQQDGGWQAIPETL